MQIKSSKFMLLVSFLVLLAFVNLANWNRPWNAICKFIATEKLEHWHYWFGALCNGIDQINPWQKGIDLYKRLVKRAEAALEFGGTIEAVLWYKGESDAGRPTNTYAYKGRLEQFINGLQADLNLPQLLVIEVALASGQKQYREIVRQAQLNTDLPNVKCVDAKGLPLEPDNLHLTTPAQVRLGTMMADAFLTGSIEVFVS